MKSVSHRFINLYFIMESFVSLLFNVSLNISATKTVEPGSIRIVNGYQVQISEVPYQANLHRKNASGWWYLCGASIIHPRAVLTAAHCIDTSSKYFAKYHDHEQLNIITKFVRVNVGTSKIDTGGDHYNVSSAISHPEYNKSAIHADIAFIIVAIKMKFNEKVKMIPRAPENYKVADRTEALVSGFGSISFNGPHSRTLRAAKVYITNQKVCTLTFSPLARITQSLICAYATGPAADACAGDSGGPLVANGYLIGIVSFGVECAHPVYPGVYTRVSFFYDWIDTQLIEVREKKSNILK